MDRLQYKHLLKAMYPDDESFEKAWEEYEKEERKNILERVQKLKDLHLS